MPNRFSEFRILDWLLNRFPPGSSLSSRATSPDPISDNMTSTNDLSAVFDHLSTDSALTEPGRIMDSYFPRSHRSSFSSTSSSIVAEPSGTIRHRPEPPALRPAQPTRAHTSAVPLHGASSSSSSSHAHKVDALSRHFPKPEQEPTLEELLARPPQKWSVGHYVKNAREARTPVHDKEQQARAFAEAKRELLAAKQTLERSVNGGH